MLIGPQNLACRLQNSPFVLRLVHINDKGKPDKSQGRKAMGPRFLRDTYLSRRAPRQQPEERALQKREKYDENE